uniref:Uncharacterized protein n=1 Tax=Oryza rufipogon TaxID=4529 RepID=A0A0E0QE86_ORYRU
MVLKLLDGGGGGGGDDGFNPSAAEHKRHEQIGNLAVELKHQRLASKPSAMECELKYVCMHPEQRYTLTRVKNCGYWEPLDDPSTRKTDESSGSTRFVNDVVVADVLSKNMGLAPASCSCDASDGGIMLLFGIAPRSGVDAGA